MAPFLSDAAQALGMREAELASLLGVSRSTLSGWKARGSIPANYRRWFEVEFCYVLFSRGFQSQHVEDLRHIGIRVALRALQATDFNPFGFDKLEVEERFDLSYWFFQGMCQLGHFVLLRLPLSALEQSQPEGLAAQHEALAADHIVEIMRALRVRLFGNDPVSQ